MMRLASSAEFLLVQLGVDFHLNWSSTQKQISAPGAASHVRRRVCIIGQWHWKLEKFGPIEGSH
jgi:hypothetical protein